MSAQPHPQAGWATPASLALGGQPCTQSAYNCKWTFQPAMLGINPSYRHTPSRHGQAYEPHGLGASPTTSVPVATVASPHGQPLQGTVLHTRKSTPALAQPQQKGAHRPLGYQAQGIRGICPTKPTGHLSYKATPSMLGDVADLLIHRNKHIELDNIRRK